MAIEDLHVRQTLVPGLAGAELENGSFYELLQSRYGITIVGGVQTVEPTVTNEEESALLGVPLHSPAFLFERVTRSSQGDLVEYVRSIYRGDRYRLVSELGASGAAGRALTMLQPATESGLDNWHANVPVSARGQLV
jgi:GntR family transcriptional regulator